jgi:hypothetical protein
MYSDIAPLTGGKKKCKALVEAYEAAWARSQGDEPGCYGRREGVPENPDRLAPLSQEHADR